MPKCVFFSTGYIIEALIHGRADDVHLRTTTTILNDGKIEWGKKRLNKFHISNAIYNSSESDSNKIDSVLFWVHLGAAL